jgi:uncharacterized protein YjbI with pentapeptide repeats
LAEEAVGAAGALAGLADTGLSVAGPAGTELAGAVLAGAVLAGAVLAGAELAGADTAAAALVPVGALTRWAALRTCTRITLVRSTDSFSES